MAVAADAPASAPALDPIPTGPVAGTSYLSKMELDPPRESARTRGLIAGYRRAKTPDRVDALIQAGVSFTKIELDLTAMIPPLQIDDRLALRHHQLMSALRATSTNMKGDHLPAAARKMPPARWWSWQLYQFRLEVLQTAYASELVDDIATQRRIEELQECIRGLEPPSAEPHQDPEPSS